MKCDPSGGGGTLGGGDAWFNMKALAGRAKIGVYMQIMTQLESLYGSYRCLPKMTLRKVSTMSCLASLPVWMV